MRACDVLCLPSLNEGVPNVVLEGLASGTPVVASRVGGIPEVHAGDPVGALFESGSVTELAMALQRVLASPWDSAKLRLTVSAYTWAHNAQIIKEALVQAGLCLEGK
jgi:glycosyltransferase involved in cell wall biosynthesis